MLLLQLSQFQNNCNGVVAEDISTKQEEYFRDNSAWHKNQGWDVIYFFLKFWRFFFFWVTNQWFKNRFQHNCWTSFTHANDTHNCETLNRRKQNCCFHSHSPPTNPSPAPLVSTMRSAGSSFTGYSVTLPSKKYKKRQICMVKTRIW